MAVWMAVRKVCTMAWMRVGRLVEQKAWLRAEW